MKRILVVEDEYAIRELIALNLSRAGYDPVRAPSAERALELYREAPGSYSLALLDIMLPGMDGLELCRLLRSEDSRIGIIMLTAKVQETDKVHGFAIGADDYVTKPFTPMELMARVNSQLRRYKRFMEKLQKQEAENADSVYTIGGLEVNETTFEVRVDGTLVKMTPMEFRILLLLIKNPGRVFSADEIYERVWNERAVNTETVMVHVRNIREKIEINPKVPKYLKVVWGVGYKIEKIS